MYKQITFAGYDNRTGPHIFPIEADVDRSIGHIKMARELPPTIEQYIRNSKPIPGKTQLLIDAMGAGEYYGSNVNGDYFPHEALSHEGSSHGYRTFMMYAYPFKHHVNKDPARAYGDKVVLSAYDPKMHRVLLIVRVDDSKCQDILGDLDNGTYWDVSMGCFIAGTMVTMSDGTRKPIQDIATGDSVRTHTGRNCLVTETHKRKYKGEIFSVKSEAHKTIRCTHQHPWLALPYNDVKTSTPSSNSRTWREDLLSDPDWTLADNLNEDSFLFEPVPIRDHVSTFEGGDDVSRATSRLLGYYLAEGHILKNKKGKICGVEFSTSVDDAIHDEIDELCATFKTKNEPVTSSRSNSELARTIVVFDRKLAELCLSHCGQYSKGKRLGDIVNHPKVDLLNFLGAYANGDGHGPKDGKLLFSTANEQLAYQVRDVLLTLRIPCALNPITHKPNKLVKRTTVEWVTGIGKQWAVSFIGYSSKVSDVGLLKSKNSRKFYNGLLATPVREITSLYAETYVYNFEVEGDESYLVDGLAVHNCRVPWDECSICHNRAKNRSEYCTHLRYQMNKILQDGQRVFAYNRLPKFFDISFVTIGAEKASHILSKVANAGSQHHAPSSAELGEIYYRKMATAEKAAEQSKRAEIEKEIPSHPAATIAPATSQDKEKFDSFMRNAGELKSNEAPIHNNALDRMARHPMKEIFTTLAALGIDLRPNEFQRIVLMKQGAEKLANLLESKKIIFDERVAASSIPKWAMEFRRFDNGAINEKIAMIVQPWLSERSCYPDILSTRLSRLEKAAAKDYRYDKDSQWHPMTKEQKRNASGMHGFVPASAALAAGFMVFRNIFPGLKTSGSTPMRAIAKHPWLLPMLIGAGVGAAVGLQTLSEPMPLTKNGSALRLDAKKASTYHSPINHGMVTLAYVYSQTNRPTEERQTGHYDRMITQRPELSELSKIATTTHYASQDAKIFDAIRRTRK